MGYAKPDYERYVYAYVPSIEFKEKWEKMAKKSKISLSKFIFEHVENSLRQEDDDFKPRSELINELRKITKENEDIREEMRMKKLVIEKLDTELRRYRSEEFMGNGFSEIRKYNTELIDLLKRRGSVTNEELLAALGINPRDGEAVKAIYTQLNNLQSYGLTSETMRGWRWIG